MGIHKWYVRHGARWNQTPTLQWPTDWLSVSLTTVTVLMDERIHPYACTFLTSRLRVCFLYIVKIMFLFQEFVYILLMFLVAVKKSLKTNHKNAPFFIAATNNKNHCALIKFLSKLVDLIRLMCHDLDWGIPTVKVKRKNR